ncbi:MAG: HEAT repeat domain-containing protein [Anaerolineae bacterium]
MPKRKTNLDPDFAAALDNMRKGDDVLSMATLFTLSDVTRPELEKFAETWAALPVARRRQVALALRDLAEESIEADFNRLFRHLMEDEDAEVREHALDGLWEDEDLTLINPLIGAMRSDAAARVRAAAAESLGRFVLLSETKRIPADRGERVTEALLAVVRNPAEDPLVRRRAIESIAYLGNDLVRNIIASAYADDDALMRATALFAMGRSADPYWRRTLAQELYSSDPQLRYEAARAVGELEYKAVVPRLIELLEDADREVQLAAITSLGQIGGKEAKQTLIDILEGEDEAAREIAQDALDELEFNSGSEMLLYDMGLSDQEDLQLESELLGEDWDLYKEEKLDLDDDELGEKKEEEEE